MPQSLYIHMPWCLRKCPYCDFNSHHSPSGEQRPENLYVHALLHDLAQTLNAFPNQEPIQSIFIGGGTPSLFSVAAYDQLFGGLHEQLKFAENIEITLEANPGTLDIKKFSGYRQLGINRLSIGIQSFNPNHLQALGRVHDDKQAHGAIQCARDAGFDNINLDIMHGLPQQTSDDGLRDLETALAYQPEHLSWYQLTIEPNTVFHRKPPVLPNEDDLSALEEQGFERLDEAGYLRYEVSAFCRPNRHARHNLNYWLFGDYYGIGAGAHGKWTSNVDGRIHRTEKVRQPWDYLNPSRPFIAKQRVLSADDCVFEFMLNTSRLAQSIPLDVFTQRTGLDLCRLMPGLIKAQHQGLIQLTDNAFSVTSLGRRFNNDLQAVFLAASAE